MVFLVPVLTPVSATVAETATVMVRSGDHPGFGRVVFDAAGGTAYHVVRDGDHVAVQFDGDVTLKGDPRLPHNVTALHTDGAAAGLTLAAGATFRASRFGDHVVIDVFDPAAAEQKPPSAPAAAQPRTDDAAPRRSAAGTLPRASRSTASAPASSASPAAAPASPAAPPKAAPPAVPPQSAPAAALPAHPAPAATVPPIAAPAAPPKAAPAAASPPPATPAVAAAQPRAAPSSSLATAAPVSPPRSLALPEEPPGAVPVSIPSSPSSPAASPNSPEPVPGATASVPAAAAASGIVTAQPLPQPEGGKDTAALLPLSATAGAAAFQRQDETLIVLDERHPIDVTGLSAGSPLAEARVELLPSGTVIHVAPPPGSTVSLSRSAQGWVVATVAAPPQAEPVATAFRNGALAITAREAGGVLAIPDPLTGGRLLIGTQRQAGQAMLMPGRTAQFILLPTLLGVAVAPLADSVALRTAADGFGLTTAPAPLAISAPQPDVLSDASALTHRFDFPDLPPDRLIHQMEAATAAAAAAPPLLRAPKRRAAAIAMISLGMGAEAEALLQLTASADPREAASADLAGLTAVAALLAGRPADAVGIDDPRLTGTDEIMLWRALRTAMRDDRSPRAADALSATAPLLLTYPPMIRDRLLPLAAETMVAGGAVAAAKELLAKGANLPGLDLARAMLSQAEGDTDGALRRYDALAAGRDPSLHARAAVRAVELRLAAGKLDTRQAAEALDRLLYAWRGDQRELALREKLAGLRQKLGEWRAALALLRETEPLFPDDAARVHGELQAAFDALLHGDAADRLPPIEFVALVDENADLVPATAEGEAMQARLADRLLALDLPKRAGPVLDKLVRTVPAGPARATFGQRLAALRLQEDDPAAALSALAASDVPDLPEALHEQRVILAAKAHALGGDVGGAIKLLEGLDFPGAIEVRVSILEHARDWLGADRALTDYVAKTVPETGALTDAARRSLLRLATAAARAGDEATLASLREREEARIGNGPVADMFRLLTADPVHTTADLPRSAREVGIARGLPAALQAMRP